MELTQTQEEILKQMLQAFQNGKRLCDLPNVKGTNPYDLYVEVLDTDGESKKAALATLLPYLEDQCAYGIEFDTTVSAPECTRIGNMALHRTLPVQSRMRGVLLSDNGDVVEYLDPRDWTANTRDGSRGQVMVEIPLHYRRFITDGTKRRVMLSEFPLPGYHQVPLSYVSAYEAALQRSTGTLASVVNYSADYRGGNNNAEYDGTYRTLLGRPATSINRTDFRAYARKRKPETAEWNCLTYDIHKTIYWLFAVEYATRNSQAPYNAEPTAEGCRRGGLGSGVTTWGADWNKYNKNNPFVPCGHTDSLGNGTGTVSISTSEAGEVPIKSFEVPRYRGIENPFGHLFKWVDGINIKVSPTIENGGNDLSQVFVCSNPELFNDNNYDGYSHAGNEARNNGFFSQVIFGERGEIIPEDGVRAGSTTYFCDYHYTNIATTEILNGLLCSGHAAYGDGSGLTFTFTYYTPAYKDSNIATRLCFIPANA